MRYLLLLFLLGCEPHTTQSYTSENYRKKCNNVCQRDYGTDVDYINPTIGSCHCQ